MNTGDILLSGTNKYRIGRCIGKGGLGTVFKGRSIETGKDFAIKLFHEDRFRIDGSILERLKREVSLGEKLTHKNLVKIIDWNINNNDVSKCFIVMEFVKGYLLSEAVTKLSRKSRVVVAHGLVDGVEHLHSLGLLHRDLKPNNIIIRDDNWEPVILDYGTIKLVEDDLFITNSTDKLGSLLYISENQRMMPENAGINDDIYSLCLILYEVYSGKRVSVSWDISDIEAEQQLKNLIVSVIKQKYDDITFPKITDIRDAVKNKYPPLTCICVDDGENIRYFSYNYDDFIRFSRDLGLYVGVGISQEDAYSSKERIARSRPRWGW